MGSYFQTHLGPEYRSSESDKVFIFRSVEDRSGVGDWTGSGTAKVGYFVPLAANGSRTGMANGIVVKPKATSN
jgi:hypothetical protein